MTGLLAGCEACSWLAEAIKWRNAVDLHHIPGGTHWLAPRPDTLGRLTFQKWSLRTDLHRQPSPYEGAALLLRHGADGASGRVHTDNLWITRPGL